MTESQVTGLDLGQPFWALLTSHCWPSQLGLHSWAYKAIPLPQGGVSSKLHPPPRWTEELEQESYRPVSLHLCLGSKATQPD